jgi:pyruvate,water dikinase
MQHPFTLPLDDSQATLENVGGKGASLAHLMRAGLPVPAGFHVTTSAYRLFVADNNLQPVLFDILAQVDSTQPDTLEEASRKIHRLFMSYPIPSIVGEAVEQAYAALPGQVPNVAIRSSATAEDLPELSFAGQQETFLNISGLEAIRDTIQRCWASLWTARAIAYRIQHNIDQNSVALAVIVQLLIDAESAGILFTANPLNGSRDEILINAAWGLGEAIVSGQVTPDILTIEKQTGKLKQMQVADKAVMTVQVNRTQGGEIGNGTTEQPVPDNRRKVATLSESQVAGLVRLAKRIETLHSSPQDIEWCQAGGKMYILQSRPITSLPPAPLEWPRRNPKGIYMRGSLVDLLPDPLSPLFETMGIPAVVRGAYKVGSLITRSEAVLPDEYYTSINHYAYMNAGFSSRSWGWILFHMLPSYPRMLRRLIPFWRDEVHPGYQQAVARLGKTSLEERSNKQLWAEAQELTDAAMYYMASLLFATMGASAGSEMLNNRVYQKLVQRPGDPPAAVLLMGYDSLPILAEKSLFDVSMHCRQFPDLVDTFIKMTGREIAESFKENHPPTGISQESWQAFYEQFNHHLIRFGHMIYQLDFAHPLPVNDPAPLLETIKMYLGGGGMNPYERQQKSAQQREQVSQTALMRLKGVKRWAFKTSLRIGQAMSQVREDALADIGLGYPLLRRMFAELGQRFSLAGVLDQAEDIFWLKKEEIDAIVDGMDGNKSLTSYADRISQRKEEWMALKRITPPSMIPMKEKYMGFKMDLYTAASESEQTASLLKGVPTSAGKVTAPARVLHGSQDFHQMQPGEVLVAGTTTPAWTPLFAMASAVVTDIGGPLTHGSIVAREYGIPAVMGTGVATRRIHTGQRITVDGDLGTVTLHGDDGYVEA